MVSGKKAKDKEANARREKSRGEREEKATARTDLIPTIPSPMPFTVDGPGFFGSCEDSGAKSERSTWTPHQRAAADGALAAGCRVRVSCERKQAVWVTAYLARQLKTRFLAGYLPNDNQIVLWNVDAPETPEGYEEDDD